MEHVAEYADILQIGARNMQNYSLLMAVGRIGRPVLLKRGLAGTIEEWLMAAEYVMSSGNPNVILCERGIRTFETAYRNTLDVTAVPLVHQLTHLPVMIDPSHAAGKRWLVAPLALAGTAAGADGLLIEVHPRPVGGALRRRPVRDPGPVRRARHRRPGRPRAGPRDPRHAGAGHGRRRPRLTPRR